MTSNLELAKQALSHLQLRFDEQQRGVDRYTPLNYNPLLNLMADDGVFWAPCPPETPVFGTEFRGREELRRLFLNDDPELFADLEMTRRPQYFDGGDRIVVLYAFSYRIKNADVVAADKDVALVLDFHDGRITCAVEISDMSEWVVSQGS